VFALLGNGCDEVELGCDVFEAKSEYYLKKRDKVKKHTMSFLDLFSTPFGSAPIESLGRLQSKPHMID
jgi:hypothetical protein